MALSAGAIVAERYRVERLIGEGGMGAVYEATNLKLDKRVALKLLSDSASPELAERFQREAIAASRVKHPAIVTIYDADVDRGRPWIAMELLEGESLRERMAKGPVPREQAMDLVAETLDALTAVHDAGIVHRDLKPDNLFLERYARGERVKILDFGIAKVAIEALGKATATHAAMGTPHYLAPEQATSAKQAGPPADVYGMAVVLFELLSGELPYQADTFGDLVRRMFTEGPRSLATLAPEVPPAIAALVDRCLRTEPSARPPDARAFAQALRAARAAPPLAEPERRVAQTVQLSSAVLEAALKSDPGVAATPAQEEPLAVEGSRGGVAQTIAMEGTSGAASSARGHLADDEDDEDDEDEELSGTDEDEDDDADDDEEEEAAPVAPTPPPKKTRAKRKAPRPVAPVRTEVLPQGPTLAKKPGGGAMDRVVPLALGVVALFAVIAWGVSRCGGEDEAAVARLDAEAGGSAAALGAGVPERYRVLLQTTQGPIPIDVTREWAPHAADRFHALVREGFYRDVAFFRVIAGFMAQTGIHGDPEVNRRWQSRTIPDDPVRQRNVRGMVTFASGGPGTRTTQFFINLVDNTNLDALGFAPFGRVDESAMFAVDRLYARYGEGAPSGSGPLQSRIQSEGNAYLRAAFPSLDYIQAASIADP